MKKILFFFAELFFISATAQVQTVSKSAYENADFKSFTTLQKDLENVRIVGLGESGHLMGETYVSKTKMVKYLHQHCGFDVLAMESPMYNLSVYYEEYVKQNKVTALNFLTDYSISSVWTTDDMYELFDYILETQKTDRPLIYTGFDSKLFHTKKTYLLDKDYNQFIQKLNTDTHSNIKVDSLFAKALYRTAQLSYYLNKIQPNDTLVLHNTFKEVKSALDKVQQKNGYYHFWELVTEHIISLYKKGYSTPISRDELMAKNVSYLANIQFPDKKIILWAATVHLLADITKMDIYKTRSKETTMGYFLREEFKDEYYVMAFVPASGVTGLKGYLGLAKKKAKAKKNSLERYILEKYNPDYAFISLRNENSQVEIADNQILKANLLALDSDKVEISSVVDAYFYLKKEHLVSFSKRETYLKQRKEK